MAEHSPSSAPAASLARPIRNLGWLLGSRGVNAVLSLVYLALATRALGLEGFGHFTLMIVMAQAITGFASFSTWQTVIRWGSVDGQESRATGFAVALDLVSVVAGSAIVLAAVWLAPYWLPLPADLRGWALVLCLGTLWTIRSTPTGVLRLHDRYDRAAAAETALPLARAVGAVAAWLFFPRIGGFVAAWAFAEFACAAAYWRFAWRITPLRAADVSLTALPRADPGVWRFVLATNLSRSLAVSSKQIVVLLVGALGGAALAGAFRVASQIGQAMVQLGEAVSRSLYPELIRAQHAAHGLASRAAALSLGAGSLAVAFAAVFGEWGLAAVAGPHFAFAARAMTVLVAAGAIELLCASWDALLVARGRAELPFLLRLWPLALSLTLLPWGISHYGLIGAALCVLLASLLTALGLGRAARLSRLRCGPLPRSGD